MTQEEKRVEFENFKSNVCHQVKEMGEKNYIIYALSNNVVMEYWKKQWYSECFYSLAMVDYLSRKNKIPWCAEYDTLRGYKMQDIVYPQSAYAYSVIMRDPDYLKKCFDEAIPEFRRHNIVESEVENVV